MNKRLLKFREAYLVDFDSRFENVNNYETYDDYIQQFGLIYPPIQNNRNHHRNHNYNPTQRVGEEEIEEFLQPTRRKRKKEERK
jgi:hypothetical protein